MTEASAALTLLTPKDHRRGGDVLRSAGRPLFGVALSIRDDDDRELPVGRSGEVCARAGNFMREYWNRPDETKEAFRDGWYHSGDSGYVDDEGYLFIVDRLKDMIVTGGENVYSIEVENAISTHPAVAQVAVIGIPDDLWGEAVHAVVVLHPGRVATAEELTEHARQSIAGYKLPKSIEFRTEPLPLSGALEATEAGAAEAVLGRPRPRGLTSERAERLPRSRRSSPRLERAPLERSVGSTAREAAGVAVRLDPGLGEGLRVDRHFVELAQEALHRLDGLLPSSPDPGPAPSCRRP